MAFQKGHQRIPNSGRQLGTTNKNTAAIKALASKSVEQIVAELVRLALHATSEAVQVAACKELLDRAIGKAVQPHSGETGEGPVVVQVITGVPRAEGEYRSLEISNACAIASGSPASSRLPLMRHYREV
jgi:hypothetical protein